MERSAGRQPSRRSAARILVTLLLGIAAAAAAVLGVAAIVDAATGHREAGAGGGIAFALIVALLTGSGAWAVARGGSHARTPAGAAAPASAADVIPGAGPGPGLVRPPGPGDQVSYRERASQFPVAGAAVGACLLAASVAGLVVIGGPNGPGAGAAGFFALLGALGSALYLALTALDLPNGIEITAGRFAVGVHGVQPAGRLWRRVTGPLDAVRSWDVLSPSQVRCLTASRRTVRPAGRRVQYLGDLRLFSRRHVLQLIVDPAAVQARLPGRILEGYVFVDAARAGAVWDGWVLIGTRRPDALAAALERARPGLRPSGIAAEDR